MPPYAQQYGPPKQPMDIGEILKKRFLIVLVLIGALLLFVARIILIYQQTDRDIRNAAYLVQTLGAFMIAGPAVVWAIGSKRTTDMQNVGLLVLAAILLAYFG